MKARNPNSANIRPAAYRIGLALLVSCGCSNGQQAKQIVPPPVQELQPSDIMKQEGFEDVHLGLPSQKPKDAGAGMDKRYEFAAHPEAAHLRSGGLLVDFGTSARDKHTLADWMSGIKGNYNQDGVTYSLVTGNTGHIYFYADETEAGGGSIAFRLKAEGAEKARIYLNDEYVGSIAAEPEFGHALVAFESGIHTGLNEIKIQSNGKKRTKEGPVAALALDYARILFHDTEDGPAASSADTLQTGGGSDGRPGLALARGESATYYLPIPKDARILGTVRPQDANAEAQLTVSVHTDTGGEAASLDLTVEKSAPFALDLSAVAGEAAAVTFIAPSGSIELKGTALYEKHVPRVKAPGTPRAKNAILVLIDTLRSDKLDLYTPDTPVRTSYLSSLSNQAMVFERAFAPENWTKPSTASLLSGLYPETHGAKGDRDVLPSGVILIPEHLKALGFMTAGFVANGYVSDKFGFRQGWDTWTNYVRQGKPNRAQYVVGDAVEWLDKRTDDRPFFMYIHTIDPHVPYIPPQKYLKMYDDGLYNGPVKSTQTAKIAEGIKTGRVKLNERDKVRFEALYNGEITYHDDQLVALQDKLAELGLLKDTVIIITSDHGEEFYDHGSVGHGHSLYEELLHIPLVVRLPGTETTAGAAPARDSDEVSLVDVFPTLCDLLGVECPAEVAGHSLVPRLKAEARDDFPSARVSDFLMSQKTIRMGRFKLIYRGLRTTLFDLENDPDETRDLSDEYPIALVTLRDALSRHLERFADTPRDINDKAAPKKHKAEKAVIDKETEAQLKALGYLGGE